MATDQQDGTYLIIFTPDQPGNLKLSITIRGHPIKVSLLSVCFFFPEYKNLSFREAPSQSTFGNQGSIEVFSIAAHFVLPEEVKRHLADVVGKCQVNTNKL